MWSTPAPAPARSQPAMDVATHLLQLLRTANEAWTSGRPHDVEGLYHPAVVLSGPDGRALLEGREAMLESYAEFCEGARVDDFQEYNHRVAVTGDTAVVSYEFAIEFTVFDEGESHAERGRELLVFAKDAGEWAVVWREQTPLG